MDHEWKVPGCLSESAHYVEEKVLENAFWIARKVNLPRDIWNEIFDKIVDKRATPLCPMQFLLNFFKSPVQMKRNPIVVCEGENFSGCGPSQNPCIYCKEHKRSSCGKRSNHVDGSEFDDSSDFDGEELENGKDFMYGMRDIGLINTGTKYLDQIPNIALLPNFLVGFWLAHEDVSKVKRLSLQIHETIKLDVNLDSPLFLLKNGAVYAIPNVIFPIGECNLSHGIKVRQECECQIGSLKIMGCEYRRMLDFETFLVGDDIIVKDGVAALRMYVTDKLDDARIW